VLLGRRQALLDAKAAAIGGRGIACDVGDPDSVDAALDAAVTAHGPARILINAAADGRLAPLLKPDGTAFPRSSFGEIVATNLLGPMYLTQGFAARLVREPSLADEQRGVVVQISSLAGSDGTIGAAYAASKGGLNALTLSVARELAPWGIRVMTIAPGAIDTEMLREHATPEVYATIARDEVFPRRLGRPEECAATALHICENDYLNGSIIRLDGGVRRNALRPVIDAGTLTAGERPRREG
jgi:NAD(P)-dependent dehydrogenase (short-subunit alcohol dehydrogenase family)